MKSVGRGLIKENTANISAFFRRLDTIARFLEVDQTCTATSLISGKLFISSNKLEYSLNQAPKKIESLQEGIKLLTSFQNVGFRSSKWTAYNRIYGSNIEELQTSQALSIWCDNSEYINKVEAKRYYKILTQNKYDYKQPYKNYEYIKAVKFFLEELRPEKLEILEIDDGYKNVLELMHENLQKMHARAYQDAHKIVELMTTDKFPELKQAIQNFEDGGFIFPYEESEAGKDHHAEMNIIRFIYENEYYGTGSIMLA